MEFTTLKTLTDGIIDLVVEFHYNGHGNYGVLPFYRCGIYLAGAPVKVGNLTLRIQPTRPNPREIEQLLYEGNIGYSIFEPYRGKGYAGRACKLAAKIARQHALTELLINCNVENKASMRVIEKLGAQKVKEFDTPASHLDENDPTPRRAQFRWRIDAE